MAVTDGRHGLADRRAAVADRGSHRRGSWLAGAARPTRCGAASRPALGRDAETDARPRWATRSPSSSGVRLDERDLLFDTVPRPALTPPDWLRIFSVEKLQRQPDRIYIGRARIAFYRPGRQAVPVFQLPFMRSVKGLSRGTLSSDSASVEVVPVLQAGSSATLRDIKEPVRARGARSARAGCWALAALAAGGLARVARRGAGPRPRLRRRRRIGTAAAAARSRTTVALGRLDRDRARSGGAARDVARHYAGGDRRAARLPRGGRRHPARERTTSELLLGAAARVCSRVRCGAGVRGASSTRPTW